MGTNFYLKDSENTHIGKRSAAGYYCWDCNVTLCKDGEEGVHQGSDWHKACPVCGAKFQAESLDCSAAGRELGFNTSQPKAGTGVSTVCSFTWAMKPDHLVRRMEKGVQVVDEYGREYSPSEFGDVMEACPLQYYHSIGQDFS